MTITSWKKLTGLALGLGLLLLAVIIALRFSGQPSLRLDDLGARALQPPMAMPPFQLVDQAGQSFTTDRLQGQWTLAMIGFTFCPDICPTILAQVADFFDRLPTGDDHSRRPEFLFVSVDPFRDTPEELGRYVSYFRPGFIGLTGQPAELHRLVEALGLFYIYTDPDDDQFLEDRLRQPAKKDYGVVHSTRLLFISPEAELVAVLPQPFTAADILSVFTRLTAFYGNKP